MSARVLILLFAAVFAALSFAAGNADFEYGPRPLRPVYDPNGFLDAAALAGIGDPLAAIFKNEGVDVIVVILPDLEGAPPPHVAGRFAAAWCDSQIHAVVLHVPGNPESPWIVPKGELIEWFKPEVLARDITESERRARAEPDEAGKVRAASVEACDRLRYWKGTAINRIGYLTEARARILVDRETRARQWRVAALTGAAAAVPVLIGASVLLRMLRRPGPRRFPETRPPRRLGAPHCGGNHAVAALGAPPSPLEP